LQKVLGLFSKKVRSTVVVNRRALLLLCYAIGECGNNFNITNIEFGCRHCRPLPTTADHLIRHLTVTPSPVVVYFAKVLERAVAVIKTRQSNADTTDIIILLIFLISSASFSKEYSYTFIV
jgi:hypothetical protein